MYSILFALSLKLSTVDSLHFDRNPAKLHAAVHQRHCMPFPAKAPIGHLSHVLGA